uniref:Chromosome 12 open reading frame 50 n=1 Tax=Myotis lucifugus TaxID=59463 RepID=G1PIQ8_MYOLU
MEMQQNCSISCFWETQPLGCVKISCIFYHSKPRNINGLFLPPSSNITLQKDTQEGTPPLTQSQEPLKPQENISRPIHHPLVLKTNFEEEEEEVNEQNDASSLWTKTPEEIEEKRAIKEMCYKSGRLGEYYRVHTPPDISSSKSTASTPEKELEKPLENGSELQEVQGDGLTVPTKFSLIERHGEVKASLDRKPRTDIVAFENGGGDCYIPQRIIFLGVDEKKEKEITMSKCSNTKEDNKDSPHPKRSLATRLAPTAHVLNATENISLKCREDPSSMNDVQPVRKPHFKGVKKRKWVYDEPKNFPGQGVRRALQTPNPKNKTSYHRSNKDRNAENASYIHVQRDAVRTVSLNAPPCSRPTHGFYNKVNANKEPKLNLCPDKYMSTPYNGSAWRKRIPFSKAYSKTQKIYTEPRRNGSK